jgi:hypothetical protein
LAPRRLNRRSATAVQKPELNPRSVSQFPDNPSQSIDFPHEMPFGYTPDGWVARHLGKHIGIQRTERSFGPQARSCNGGFTPGVSPSHTHNIKIIVPIHHKLLFLKLLDPIPLTLFSYAKPRKDLCQKILDMRLARYFSKLPESFMQMQQCKFFRKPSLRGCRPDRDAQPLPQDSGHDADLVIKAESMLTPSSPSSLFRMESRRLCTPLPVFAET